jgi:hypothetical protein
MHDFERSIGIELLESLFNKSVELKNIYDSTEENKSVNPESKIKPTFEVY